MLGTLVRRLEGRASLIYHTRASDTELFMLDFNLPIENAIDQIEDIHFSRTKIRVDRPRLEQMSVAAPAAASGPSLWK